MVTQSIENIIAKNNEEILPSSGQGVNILINDEWFFKTVKTKVRKTKHAYLCDIFYSQAVDVIKSKINRPRIFQILSEVKSEQKLNQIFESVRNEFDLNLLSTMIECSFASMTTRFKHDCFQHNAHMNYLKLTPILKQSMLMLSIKMDEIFSILDQNNEAPSSGRQIICDQSTYELKAVMASLSTFLKCIATLQQQCMIYVEVSFVNKFFIKHFFKAINFQRLFQFAFVCLNFIEKPQSSTNQANEDDLTIACDCLNQIIRTQTIFNESENYFATDKSYTFFHKLLEILYEVVRLNLSNKSFLEKHQLNTLINEQNKVRTDVADAESLYAKAIFLGVFVENAFNRTNANECQEMEIHNLLNSFRENILSLIIATLRSDSFYFFAVTPREIINSFEWQPNPSLVSKKITFQSVPIDCLNEIEIVEKFLQR